MISKLSVMVTFFPIIAGIVIYLFGKIPFEDESGKPEEQDSFSFIALGIAIAILVMSVVLVNMYYSTSGERTEFGQSYWILGRHAHALPNLNRVGFDFNVDGLSSLLLIVFSLLVTIAILYSIRYFPNGGDNSYYACLLVFLGGMNGVVLATDLIQFYFFWEFMLIPSWILVSYWGENENPRATALKYFIFTHVGAVLMFIGLLWIASLTGTTDMTYIQKKLQDLLISGGVTSHTLNVIAWLIALGFMFKMATVPFHTWLPDTYVSAPMPVTVVLAAGMINTGVYGLVRFFFNVLPPEAVIPLGHALMVMAVISQYYGGLMALAEKEIKRMVAYSSISQMGYMLFGISASLLMLTHATSPGSGLGVAGTIFHMLNHGLAKALLFLVVGAVALSTGARYFHELGGLVDKSPLLAFWATIGALTLVGAPPLAGFTSEWMIFGGGFGTPYWGLSILALGATILTMSYSLWLVKRVFYGPFRLNTGKNIEEVPASWHVSMGTLAVLSAVIGIWPAPFFALVKSAVTEAMPFLL